MPSAWKDWNAQLYPNWLPAEITQERASLSEFCLCRLMRILHEGHRNLIAHRNFFLNHLKTIMRDQLGMAKRIGPGKLDGLLNPRRLPDLSTCAPPLPHVDSTSCPLAEVVLKYGESDIPELPIPRVKPGYYSQPRTPTEASPDLAPPNDACNLPCSECFNFNLSE